MGNKKLSALLSEGGAYAFSAEAEINKALAGFDKKVIVLDDDPTGVQTVHDVPVYTAWDQRSVDKGFTDAGMFFILTNSRGLTAENAATVNRDIASRVFEASRAKDRDFVLISRSDSTLRGHYPLETRTLKERLEYLGYPPFDGEIICPFFIEGGRYTYCNIHYVLYGETLIPAGDTEFAKDKSFGYVSSDLTCWVEEKTGGEFRKEDVIAVSTEDIRRGGPVAVAKLLGRARDFKKVVVNALSYDDIKLFVAGYIKAALAGKRFMFRSAAAIPKVLGGIPDMPLLGRDQCATGTENGGLTIIGSHVEKTTRQLMTLLEKTDVVPVEFNQHLVLEPAAFEAERERVQTAANDLIKSGKDAVIFTKRERIDMNTGSVEDELKLSRAISDAVTGFVKGLAAQPSYIIAKGGITSSDIGTAGLLVKRATVAGQVLPGVPVWRLGEESRFPGMAYIIFPGNVGDDDALAKIVTMFNASSQPVAEGSEVL